MIWLDRVVILIGLALVQYGLQLNIATVIGVFLIFLPFLDRLHGR